MSSLEAEPQRDTEWIEFLEEHEDQIRREAQSNAPDAKHFQNYLDQLEDQS